MDSTSGAARLLDAAAGDRPGQHLYTGVLLTPQSDRRADQRADRVGVEGAAQRQRLRPGQPQFTADHQPSLTLARSRQGWLGQADAGVCAGPGCLDGAFDQAGWDDAGHPQPDRDPGFGEHVLARHVRLAGERPPPPRAEQADEVGPQRGAARGIHCGRGEHGDLAGISQQQFVAAACPPPSAEHDPGDEHREDRRRDRAPVQGEVPQPCQQCEQGTAGVAQVVLHPPGGDSGRRMRGPVSYTH